MISNQKDKDYLHKYKKAAEKGVVSCPTQRDFKKAFRVKNPQKGFITTVLSDTCLILSFALWLFIGLLLAFSLSGFENEYPSLSKFIMFVIVIVYMISAGITKHVYETTFINANKTFHKSGLARVFKIKNISIKDFKRDACDIEDKYITLYLEELVKQERLPTNMDVPWLKYISSIIDGNNEKNELKKTLQEDLAKIKQANQSKNSEVITKMEEA